MTNTKKISLAEFNDLANACRLQDGKLTRETFLEASPEFKAFKPEVGVMYRMSDIPEGPGTRPLTQEELSTRVDIEGDRMMRSSDIYTFCENVSLRLASSQTVESLLTAIELMELHSRGGRECDHVFFEGLDVEEDGALVPSWGS